MKCRTIIALCGVVTLVAAAPLASAATINIDFGRDNNPTAGNWNNVGGPEPPPGSTFPTATWPLIDDTGTPTGISLGTDAPGAIAGSGADYAGPYPTEVAGVPSSALSDSVFIRNTSTTMVLSGLSASETYDFLIYGARGNNGGQADFDVTGGNGTSNLSIADVFNNSMLVATVSGVTPDGNGEISIAYSTPSNDDSGGLNFMQITSNPIPEPSSVLLVALGSIGLVAMCRR